jgi:uncharacterized protein YunC (DUF1805 family)
MSEVEISRIEIDGRGFLGVRVDMPNAPLLLIKGKRGFAMCGYLNPETAEKLGDIAVIVSGVRSFDDMLNARIKWVSSRGKELGIYKGTVLRDVISKL